MKKYLKTIKVVLILGILFFVGCYFYAKNYWKNFSSEAQILALTTEIRNAKKLPEKFYELYKIENPNTLTHSLNRLMVTAIFTSDFIKPPSSSVAIFYENSKEFKGVIYRYKLREISLSWEIESKVSQKECLNWIAAKYDFMNEAIGIESASNLYFKKNLHKLTERELACLVIMMRNPSLYNPFRRKELVDKKTNELLAKLKDKNSSQ
ncbi:transglycosylase domain-containing protein [Aquimarina sediminis]|uniref:transglycosylase domain-containing protein n=1 Tax=Aquimarina sediminis TaxID=2070536 RepID=UPI000CA055B7|nr:transglycosylase domain-containing protein [Aquimarina sediminis]